MQSMVLISGGVPEPERPRDALARVRALRANPPGLAGTEPERHAVFGAALEQFEQLLGAAELSGPASAPLPLFYALSQAGRAIAAARLRDPQRWDYTGHGLSGRKSYASTIGDARVTTQASKRNNDAFQVVSDASGSPLFPAETSLRLGELWASLPGLVVQDGLGAGHPRALGVHGDAGANHGLTSFYEDLPDVESAEAWVSSQLQPYPHARGGVAQVKREYNRVEVYFRWPDARVEDLAERDWSNDRYFYLRPAVVAAQPPPSILMTWWAILFAFSQLARYEPARWTAAINPDTSVLTVPIEEGLRTAKRSLPRLVYHGITGSWG